jgi:hypothetical protein
MQQRYNKLINKNTNCTFFFKKATTFAIDAVKTQKRHPKTARQNEETQR